MTETLTRAEAVGILLGGFERAIAPTLGSIAQRVKTEADLTAIADELVAIMREKPKRI